MPRRRSVWLLRDETKCFAFLAGHESFAAAEGAIGIARTANKARKEPLRVILNGLGKDAAYIISRIKDVYKRKRQGTSTQASRGRFSISPPVLSTLPPSF